MRQNKQRIIIALGGSIIVPDKININFLKKFRKFILQEVKKGRKFIIVVGGGSTARTYQRAVLKIGRVVDEDLDWLGIHSTRLNAHLLRTIFRQEAYPVILDYPYKPIDDKYSVIIASGWRPGWSTDYIAALLAQRFGIKQIIDTGNISYVFSADIARKKNAKPIKKLTWAEYRKLIGSRWKPGMAAPIDPIAAKLNQKLKIKAYVIKGTNFANIKNILEGKHFKGTIIE